MAKKTKDNKKIVFKVLKVLLLIVVACIIAFVAHTMRNFFILKDIASKQSDLSHLSSYTRVTEHYNDGKLTSILKTFRLKNKQVMIMVRAGYDVTITAYQDLTTGEQVSVFATTTEKQYQRNETAASEDVSFGEYADYDDRVLISAGIRSIITSEKMDGKDCYKIERIDGSGTYQYIEKSTGLVIKEKFIINQDNTYNMNKYNFDRVDESIFELPDLSQYQEIK